MSSGRVGVDDQTGVVMWANGAVLDSDVIYGIAPAAHEPAARVTTPHGGRVKQVDARPSGRHTEQIYGRAAARIRFSGDVGVYGGGLLRGVADELEAGLKGVADDAPGSISYHTVTLTSRRAKGLESRLRDLIAEYAEANSTAKTARRFGVLGVLAPLPGEGDA